ncbi:MAG: glycosyltransferase, partial [Candidatus Micrarchaeaceae archaeon]
DRNRNPENYIGIIERLQDFTLYIVGRWRVNAEYQEFLKLLRLRKVSDQVIVEDNISESNLQNLYKMAKFSLRYGKDEYGPGMSNIESISHLTPIIVNSELGISDVILEYGGGMVVDSWDSGAIISFIKEKNNELTYQRLQDQLLEIARQYTWERQGKARCV